MQALLAAPRRLLASSTKPLAGMASLFKLKAIETVELVPGHLKKEIIMAGAGGTPEKGNNVTAHYSGKLLDGSDFDSSRQRGRPFQFKIGIGQVIQVRPARSIARVRARAACAPAACARMYACKHNAPGTQRTQLKCARAGQTRTLERALCRPLTLVFSRFCDCHTRSS